MDHFWTPIWRKLDHFCTPINTECGKLMRRRVKTPGKDGKGGYDFWGCTGYPECEAVLNE